LGIRAQKKEKKKEFKPLTTGHAGRFTSGWGFLFHAAFHAKEENRPEWRVSRGRVTGAGV
jgi:hypothetical protein